MKVMAAGGFKRVEISELITPGHQRQLTLACIAARAAGLVPLLNGRAVPPIHGTEVQKELAKPWASELLLPKEIQTVKSAYPTRQATTVRPV